MATLTPPISLPIDQIRSQFDQHDSSVPLVISAPTGSGKSTQIPRWCAQRSQAITQAASPRPVLVIEPRRVACRSLAHRVAELENVTLGKEVGYTVRDEDVSSQNTLIRFVTTGVALRLWRQEHLSDYAAVIIDEFHERNLDVDLLLALCQAHPGPQLIVMSATFAADALADHLGGIHLAGEGKRFPVEVSYHPFGHTSPNPRGLIDALLPLIEEACDRAPKPGGDILVFLPGKGEISETEYRLTSRWRDHPHDQSREVLPLHGSLSLDEQSRIFQPTTKQRIILATNVAETSLTVPRISVVIDSGLVRRTRYDRGRGALALTEIALDSAEQRRGRAGRLCPGICLRMWSSTAPLKQHTPPEIHREALTPLLLAIGACGEQVESLSFVDPPKSEALEDARTVLHALQALDDLGNLTACGQALFELGLDPGLGRWIVEGIQGGPLLDLIDLVSALSTPRSLFRRGLPEHPELDLRIHGCDAVGLIRAMRTPIAEAKHEHLNLDALGEARRNRTRLIRGLELLIEVPARQPHRDDKIDRRALALALLQADPRSAYIRRERRKRHEAWCGLGPELSLGKDTAISLQRNHDPHFRCDALIVLEQHASVHGGRRADHQITLAMPVPLAWLNHAGLGEEQLGEVSLRGDQLTVEVERVFAKRILHTEQRVPRGDMARQAFVQCLLRGQRWPTLHQEVSERLSRLALSQQLNLLKGMTPTSIQKEVIETDPARWLLTRLAELGMEDSDDLSLLSRDDLLPDPLEDQESAELNKAFPPRLNMSDAHYLFHYDVPKRRVIMEQISGSRRNPPRIEWLPKCGGFEIRFKQGQHDRALRPRKSLR